MTRASRWLLVVGMVTLAGPAFAGKVGFVEVERAVATVQEGRAKLEELKAWAEPNNQRVEQVGQRVAELQRQVVQQRGVANAEALARLEAEELDARRRFEDLRRDLARELDARQNQLLGEVARKLNQVVSDYAKANDYDAIFILKDSMLIYLASASDLTDTIIRLYDERFPLK